jgi:hypothetical protein
MADSITRRRSWIVWLGVPLLLALVPYLCYTQPELWIPFAGTAEQKALLTVVRNNGSFGRRDNDPVAPVVAVHFNLLSRVNSRQLEALQGLPELETLSIERPEFSGDELSSLAGLSHLKVLWLLQGKLSGGAGPSLCHLAQLSTLSLMGSPVADEFLKQLGPLPALEVLDLSETAVHGPGLGHLKSQPRLRELRLRGCVLTEGLAALSEVPSLRDLDLRLSRLDERAVKELKGLTNVHLMLSEASLSPSLREELQAVPNLKAIFSQD